MKKLSTSTIPPSHTVALDTGALAIVEGGASTEQTDELRRRQDAIEKVLGLPGVESSDPGAPNVEQAKRDDRGLAKPADR